MLPQLLLGFLLASVIGYAGYRRQALSSSGMLGAVLLGSVIFGLGGWAPGSLLVVFFVSSSAASLFSQARKRQLADKFSKGSRRDLGQALANGGVGALIVVANAIWPQPAWWIAYAGAMATVNADTWATELGVLSRTQPRLIATGREVETGTSGGVTIAGTLAALAGAVLIAVTAAIFLAAGAVNIAGEGGLEAALGLLLVGSVAGLLGSLADSFLGASVQAIHYCDRCRKETERHPVHNCGATTRRVRGWAWLDNDWVNFISSALGAGLAVLLWMTL
jgi:uncharacterized protein (TIGR00297 family)